MDFLVRLLFGMYMSVYILLYVYNIIFSQMTSFSHLAFHDLNASLLGFFPLPTLRHGDFVESLRPVFQPLEATCFPVFWQQRRG